jgi:predicted MFS family arabinose efflux permease
LHMPGVIERCSLPPSLAGTWLAVSGAANIAGSIAIGFAMKRRSADGLLAMLYSVRAGGIALLLLLPVSSEAMLLFGVVMGASYMATLPPTAQLVARDHGIARLGTLFGVVMVVHQLGSFAGIWLGGWAAEATGSDTLLWLVDLALSLAAAWIVVPTRAKPRNSARSRAAA